jgi:hypothetical protein
MEIKAFHAINGAQYEDFIADLFNATIVNCKSVNPIHRM